MTFAPVQGGFSLRVELLPGCSQLRTRRYAAREMDRPTFARGGPLLESFGGSQGAFCICVWHQQRELVAADAKCAVRVADRVREELAYVAQNGVASSVPLRVVDQLEIVEVNQQERKRHLIAVEPLQLPIKLFMKGAIVAKASQPVAHGIC